MHRNNSRDANFDRGQCRRRPCSRCGTVHPPRNCPAYGSSCFKCGRFGHFASVCRQNISGPANRVSSLDDEGFFLGQLTVDNVQRAFWKATVDLNSNKVTFKLDTGADVNILPRHCILQTKTRDFSRNLRYLVVDLNVAPILGAEACQDLQLIQRLWDLDSSGELTDAGAPAAKYAAATDVIKDFQDVFTGIGQLPGTVAITLQDGAAPSIAAPRKIPLAITEKVKAELDMMSVTTSSPRSAHQRIG
ncbi:unnamed protein product [Ixodes hexagonus]